MAQPWSFAVAFFVITFTVVVKRSQTLRYYVRLYAYYGVVSIFAGLLCVPAIFRPFSPANMVPISVVARMVAWAMGVKFTLLHAERIPKDKRFVLVANHQSSLDVLATLCVWNEFHPLAPVLKRELMYTGPMALLCYLSGGIFLNRHNPKQSHGAVNNQLADVLTGKASFLFFPEGTRSGERKMLPFKKGAFHMAVDSQASILPVVLSYYKSIFSPKEKIFGQGTVTMTVLPAFGTQGLGKDDVASVATRVYNLMQAELDQQAAAEQIAAVGGVRGLFNDHSPVAATEAGSGGAFQPHEKKEHSENTGSYHAT